MNSWQNGRPGRNKLLDRLGDREAALKRQRELAARSSVRRKAPPEVPMVPATTTEAVVAPPPKKPTVLLSGTPVLSLLTEGKGKPMPQHLTPALIEAVDAYLRAAQCGSREVLLLWPGTLTCLPLIHAIATLERWANGYKLGLRGAFYPATKASFRELNHLFVDRDEIHTMNLDVQSVGTPPGPLSKERCDNKDLMFYALNSMRAEAVSEGLQPCLNELLAHFDLLTGERSELAGLNYGERYLAHLSTKLKRLAYKRDLRERILPELGKAQTVPDALFGLSHKMSKRQIEEALKNLKRWGRVDAILLDATRASFVRTEKLIGRITAVLTLIDEVFGGDGPGVLIVTNDPRQMLMLRAALHREEQRHHIQFRMGQTRGLCQPDSNLGLQPQPYQPPTVPAPGVISVEITDRESARLLNQAYRLGRDLAGFESASAALQSAAKHLQTMVNLPASAGVLHRWLNDTQADGQQRSHFDWIDYRARLRNAAKDVPVEQAVRLAEWIKVADGLLKAHEGGTPLARALVMRIKLRAGTEGRVLVATANPFYAKLAAQFFHADPANEPLRDRVRFIGTAQLRPQLEGGWPTHIVACALSAELLRWTVTTPTLPGPVDFLLTQQSAVSANYALEPVLQFPAFAPYFERVRALCAPIAAVQGLLTGIPPDHDYEPPLVTLPPKSSEGEGGGAGGDSERWPTDYVDIVLDDGRRIQRGRGARVYVYDPTSRDSRTMGFRQAHAEELRPGWLLFVMSDELRDAAEATFALAGITFAEANRYEQMLRLYHAQVRLAVQARFPTCNVADAARGIRSAMIALDPKAKAVSATNIRYWINLKRAEDTPYVELMPQAPRHQETFMLFMAALGFDAKDANNFWQGAVRPVRGSRISDGQSLIDHYARVLFDPEAAAAYDRLTPAMLDTLRANVLNNVAEVIEARLVIVTRPTEDDEPETAADLA